MNLKSLREKRMEVLKKICENQAICKLLFYSDSNPLGQPDIVNSFEQLLMTRLFPLPFIPDINNVTGATLNIFFGDIKGDGLQYKDIEIKLVVCCHIDSWLIDGEDLRPDAICEEIDKVLNGIEGLGLGVLKFSGRRPPMRITEKHYAYEISYRTFEHK